MASHLSAIELLKLGDEGREKPFLNKHWANILGVTFGISTGVIMNFVVRKPLFSGIQKHVLLTAGWCALLNFGQQKRDAYLAEKDAVYRHYVELHPEDFIEPPRHKIGDVLEPWIPVR